VFEVSRRRQRRGEVITARPRRARTVLSRCWGEDALMSDDGESRVRGVRCAPTKIDSVVMSSFRLEWHSRSPVAVRSAGDVRVDRGTAR